MPKYKIHDNGGTPFIVKVYDENNVEVFKGDESHNENPILSYTPLKVFIGKSPQNSMTEFSGGYGNKFNGNSILLENKKLDDTTYEYIFIGQTIFAFKANKIVEYVSPVGNSDVPYPYAIDVNNFTYLMIEETVLKRDWHESDDPYKYYYKNNLITTDICYVPPEEPKIKHFFNIDKFYCGDHEYTLRYNSNPMKNYDSLRARLGQPSFEDKNGVKTNFTKSMYVDCMTSYGELMGFSKMDVIRVDAPRAY